MPSPRPTPPRQGAPASPSPCPADPPTITTGPIPDAVLHALLAADEAMYPAALPWARLRAWVDACPALAVCFYHHRRRRPHDGPGREAAPVALGASVTLPLRAGPWRALLAGRLAEPDVAPAHLRGPAPTCDADGDGGGVGLHVFHVERFGVDDDDDDEARQAGRGLAARALRHALDVAAGRGWRVLGCSALTATDAGARAFAKLGFEPTGYEELWVREAGAPARMVPVLPAGEGKEGGGAVRERGSAEEVVGEAKMVVRYGEAGQGGLT